MFCSCYLLKASNNVFLCRYPGVSRKHKKLQSPSYCRSQRESHIQVSTAHPHVITLHPRRTPFWLRVWQRFVSYSCSSLCCQAPWRLHPASESDTALPERCLPRVLTSQLRKVRKNKLYKLHAQSVHCGFYVYVFLRCHMLVVDEVKPPTWLW